MKNSHFGKRAFWAILICAVLSGGLAACAAQAGNAGAVNVVKTYLEAKQNNDYEAWTATLWSAVKQPQNFDPSFEKPGDLGVLSLTIGKIEVSDEETSRIRDMYTGSDLAKSYGWSADYLSKNMIAVYAQYTVDYDNTKVPYNDGTIAQYFYLIRDDEHAPWLIWDTMETGSSG